MRGRASSSAKRSRMSAGLCAMPCGAAWAKRPYLQVRAEFDGAPNSEGSFVTVAGPEVRERPQLHDTGDHRQRARKCRAHDGRPERRRADDERQEKAAAQAQTRAS